MRSSNTSQATKRAPGSVRDAIIRVLAARPEGASLGEIEREVVAAIGSVSSSSVRSYLRLNTPSLFVRTARARYMLDRSSGLLGLERDEPDPTPKLVPAHRIGRAVIYNADCLDWLAGQRANTIHAVVTDPPYGLVEYTDEEQAKRRAGRGGVWRIPPSFDGANRAPLPRFTVLRPGHLNQLEAFFFSWSREIVRVLVPGANVVVASNPLLSYLVSGAMARAGLERRGEIVRLVMTMRGGDRPKAAHQEFSDVSVMPRSMWEPWLVFRKPLDGRAQDTLRRWGTGGFRRISELRPFGDVINSGPTRQRERQLAPHPSLKPQAFLRQIVRGVLPLGRGIVLDPFAGSGSTLAAAEAVGYESIGVERDMEFFALAANAIPRLASYLPTNDSR
jgi:site-specific DNA-methyltransferase (adenine-specific)